MLAQDIQDLQVMERPDTYTFKTKPYKHQLDIWDATKGFVYWAYFNEMGTGKSWIAINTFGWQYYMDKIDAVVITAKKGEYRNWAQYEIPAHLPDYIQREVFVFSSLNHQKTSSKKAFKSLCTPNKKRLPILVINIESLIHGGKKAMAEFFKAHPRVCFIIDESTCIKHWDSARSKETQVWAQKARTKRIMTGTAVTQAPMDLWGQSLALSRNALGFSSYYSFRNQYCVMETVQLDSMRSFKTVAGYRNLPDLARRVKNWSHQVLKADCLDLPEKIYTKRAVEMTEEQEQLYTQMRDEAMLEWEGTEVNVVNALAKISKLHQIVCGQLKTGEDTYASIPNNRISALVDILDSFPGKAIIWASYRQTLADILSTLRKEFGDGTAVGYYGAIKDSDRIKNVEAFKHGNARFMVSNPQSGGYGNTWIEATLSVYYSNSYNLEHRLQSEDRNHRIGQRNDVNYIDLVVPNTIDEKIVDILREKKSMADIVMDRPLKEWI